VSDRELLELAAKAAGEWTSLEPFEHILDRWNPLTDDGDALRLAVKLGIAVQCHLHDGVAYAAVTVGVPNAVSVSVPLTANNCAATRRAIVRAAAEIGRNMP
jgi:hypothetical protein